MDGKYYSSERSVQLLISLLKQHGIKKSLRLQELRIFRLSRVYNRMSGLRCIRAWTSVVQRIWRVVWRRNRASPWC